MIRELSKKITLNRNKKILAELKKGTTVKELAIKYNIGLSAIYMVVSRMCKDV